MKKLLAFCLACLIMCLSVPIVTVTVTAVTYDELAYPKPDEGFWSTYRDPDQYGMTEGYRPTVGFQYTSEGFTTVSAKDQWKNTSPKFTVQTSNPVNIRDGFYMQFRVDEFSYDGSATSDSRQDEWISISISDRPMIKQGATDFGNSWISLIRGSGNGKADIQSYVTTMDTYGARGSFDYTGNVYAEIPMNEDGQEIYDFEIIHEGGNFYDIKICGVSMVNMTDISSAIAQYETCYIGVTFHSGVKDGVAGCTILKQGTSKTDAVIPTGTASKEPEENPNIMADMMDSSTIPDGQPALLFDGSMSSYNGVSGANCEMTLNDDNTWHVSATGSIPYFVWSIKRSLSYEAADFPVFTMMLKNFMGYGCGAYYWSGDILSATDMAKCEMDIWHEETSRWYDKNGDEYIFVTVTLEDLWSGRINGIRPYFFISDLTDPYYTDFDVCFMAFFRSTEEAFAYADAYIDDNNDNTSTNPPVDEEIYPDNRYGYVGTFVVGGREDFTPVGDVAMNWVANADERITFDGSLSDWSEFSQSEIRPENMVSWLGNDKVDNGNGINVDANMPDGFEIKTSYLADSKYLYIGLQVTDPDAVPVYPDDPVSYTKGDAIQLQIDIGGKLKNLIQNDPDTAIIVSNYSAAFYSFGYAGDRQPLTVIRQQTDLRDDTLTVENSGVEGYTGKTADGWCAELRIPWEELYLDYMDKGWRDEENADKIIVGGNDHLPLTVDMELCYINTDDYTGSGPNWAAMTHNGSTDSKVTSNGEPVIAWDVYDMGMTLYLEPEEGICFDSRYIVVLAEGETEPEIETETNYEPDTKPAETEPDSETDPETEPTTEPETKPETNPETESKPTTLQIKVKSVQTGIVDGETVVYVTAEDGRVYRGTLSDDETLILIKEGQILSVTYVGSDMDGIYDIRDWKKLSDDASVGTQTEPLVESETQPEATQQEDQTDPPASIGGISCLSSIGVMGTPAALLLLGAALLLCRKKEA